MPTAPATAGRLLLANVGLDGYDRGLKKLARTLGDAGFECISTGLYQHPRAVAQAAVEEQADAIAVSVPSGAHPSVVRMLIHELWSRARDIPVLLVATLSPQDHAAMRAAGATEIIAPDASGSQTIAKLANALRHSA